MERLSDQLRDWHHKNPLAKRIHISDVHTVGVVALPFMQRTNAGPIEPSLDGLPVLESEVTQLPQRPAWRRLLDGVQGLLRRPSASASSAAAGSGAWAVFSEPLIDGISAAQMARFALEHGYRDRPGDPSWPQRSAPIDDTLMQAGPSQGGAWPTELYLVSAGIDAGASYTRVLIGQGDAGRLVIIGRRCLDPLRTGLALVALVGLIGFFWGYQRHVRMDAEAQAASAAASAASAASATSAADASASGASAPAASASAASSTDSPDAAASQATAASEAMASAPGAASSDASSAIASAASRDEQAQAASAPEPSIIPNIRPQLVTTPRTLKAAEEAEAARLKALEAGRARQAAAAAAASAPAQPQAQPAKADDRSRAEPKDAKQPSGGPAPAPATSPAPTPTSSRGGARPETKPAAEAEPPPNVIGKDLQRPPASANGKLVALVGPASSKKADAEAMLERLRGMVAPNIGPNTALQAQVIQTPEGWRPAIWPFASREEAQLINATLVARGMKTRAVDF